MSIADRVEDGIMLAAAGRHDGALLMATVAVAAASTARFGRALKDGPKFRAYAVPVIEHLSRIWWESRVTSGLVSKGSTVPPEYLDWNAICSAIYTHYRCALVHDGELAPAISWDPTTIAYDRFDIASIHGSIDHDVVVLQGNWLTLLNRVALYDAGPFVDPTLNRWTYNASAGHPHDRLLREKVGDLLGPLTPRQVEQFTHALDSLPLDMASKPPRHLIQGAASWALDMGFLTPLARHWSLGEKLFDKSWNILPNGWQVFEFLLDHIDWDQRQRESIW